MLDEMYREIRMYSSYQQRQLRTKRSEPNKPGKQQSSKFHVKSKRNWKGYVDAMIKRYDVFVFPDLVE